MKKNLIYSRRNRTVLLVLLLVLITALFTACGSKSSSNGEVYVYCYGDYYDQTIVDQFEQETGITVVQDTYDTAEEMYTVLENDASSYDCICTSDYMIEKMIGNGMLAELNYDNIPNAENISDVYMQKSALFDPENKYSIPYQVGVAGILYNKSMVGNKKIDSWDVLWDNKFKDQIVMPDSVRDAFQLALKRKGHSINTDNEKEINEAASDLIKQKGLVYKYANDSARDCLADGSAAIGVVWNGEYIYTSELNPDVEFVVPKEGTEFFIDSWSVLKNAANKENAEKWIDFMCKAETAATNFDYLHYTMPNKAAMDLIDEKYVKDESVFPNDETLNRCDSLKPLEDSVMDIYSKYWKEVKSE